MKYLKPLFFLAIISCKTESQDQPIDLSKFLVPGDITIRPVAAEPTIISPVDISFDDQGRTWVAEMRGYMPNIAGSGEDIPNGRISILEDKDKDGFAESSKVFLDSLLLPRAISHVYGGLLYAEPPSLWFVEINSDLTPGKRLLVDSTYAVGGNVEHQPNGLLQNIDNWIYSAKASKRYRRIDGLWQIQKTSFRGQWGITKDEFGRLLYNDNSNPLLGDFVIPNTIRMTSKSTSNINKVILKDRSVNPIQATPVNRGYMEGVLDEEEKLKTFTSACGPLVFQGTGLPKQYYNNAFVCGPEVNLIKRIAISNAGFGPVGSSVHLPNEFMITPDMGFRPVNLKNSPNGTLYAIDMHHGIIQHKTYMSSYLRQRYLDQSLDSITEMGRVLELTSNNYKRLKIDLTKTPITQLVDSLGSKNVWIRDRAQQIIIANQHDLTHELVAILNSSDSEIQRIHALYTLEGLQTLRKSHLAILNYLEFPRLSAHVLKVTADNGVLLTNNALQQIINQNDSTLDYYTSYLLGQNLNNSAIHFFVQLLDRYQESDWILEPFSAGFDNMELFKTTTNGYDKTIDFLEATIKPVEKESLPQLAGLTEGLQLYQKICSNCHGPDGEGIDRLAPPLLNSEWVSGPPERLTSILIHGMSGPISVNGIDYEFSNPMPGLIENSAIANEEIKNIANYVRNAFSSSPQDVTLDLISKIRNKSIPKQPELIID